MRILEDRSRYARGSLEALLEPGAGRTQPRCPAFGLCGGCSWQHLDYASQVQTKAGILRDALARIGGVELSGLPAMTSSPRSYGYRSRARVLMGAGDRVGYRSRRSRELCQVDGCPVLDPALEQALVRLGAQARSNGAGGGSPGAPAPCRPRFREAEVEWELVVGAAGALRVAPLPAGGEQTRLELRYGHERIGISPGVFAQGNASLFEALADAVTGAACRPPVGPGSGAVAAPGSSLIELFSGAGFLTLPLARRFARVVAMESHPAAVRDLRLNLRESGLERVEVISERVERGLPALRGQRPDVVVLDPPRAGLARGAAADLAALAAARIVYLSCDPATLARDVAELSRASYRLVHVEGFDVFPQTPHVEALVILEAPQP